MKHAEQHLPHRPRAAGVRLPGRTRPVRVEHVGMRGWRSAVVAAVAVVLAMAPSAAAAEPAVVAKAGFGIVGDARHGYVAFFTVRRAFTGAVTRLDMVSEVFDCSLATGDCPMVAQQIDVLPDRAFVDRPDLTATLSTTWAGKPLRIEWQRGGKGGLRDRDRTLVFVGTNHDELMEDYRALNSVATTTALLGGSRRCLDVLGANVAATWGAGSDLLVRVNNSPRAETVAGLRASRGRCYIEDRQPKAVRDLLTATRAATPVRPAEQTRQRAR